MRKKIYHEKMEDCPSQQGLRCSMHGEFCREENCAPLFVFKKMPEFKGLKLVDLSKVGGSK